ncbi:MAG: diguanylate cyclase [Thermomonas sp.]
MSALIRLTGFLLLLLLSTAVWAWAFELPDARQDVSPLARKLSLAIGAKHADLDGRLLFAGGISQVQTVDLQFELPLAADQRWVLWLARDPFNSARVTWMDGSTQTRNFFKPMPDAGLFPVGYAFALPRDSMGQQRLRLQLQGEIRSAPTPRVMSEQDVLRQANREFALACAIYAALVTLLIMSLVLYQAVRDPMFLLLSAYLGSALLFVSTVNGHLYALPVAGPLFGQMGARGYWWVMLAFNAMALWTLMRFAETRASTSVLIRKLDWVAAGMTVLALLPLLPLDVASRFLQPIATAAWLTAMPVGILATMDSARRRVQMAVAVGTALLLLMVGISAREAMQRGWMGDDMLTRHGYQFALVLVSLIMFVGLSSRIGLVRQRLADETSARLQSDTRLRQEQTRAGFAQSLQDRLRGVAEDELATVAFRLLGAHAREMTGASAAVVMASGYLGHELLVVQPEGQPAGLAQYLVVARGLLRAQALEREPVNVRLGGTRPEDTATKPMLAVIPLQLAFPAWAALVLPHGDKQSFEPDILAALADVARLTVMQADEAYAALQLRRTAEHDALTGSQNRRSLDQALVREFKAHGMQDAALAVLFIDIDCFKSINDKLGHAGGDLCIRSIAASLRGELRPTDAMGRYGGDEFLVLLPGRDAAAARIIAERLRKVVEGSQLYWQGEVVALTVSIGMAARRDTDRMPAELLERADKALYVAKNEGRNRVCVAPAVFD